MKLSCTVSGFSNVTEVLWKKNHKDIESVFGTSTREYTTRRTNLADGVFVETLQFTAHSAAYGGSYSCCLGVKNASRDNMFASTRLTTQPAEFDCGTLYGVVSITGRNYYRAFPSCFSRDHTCTLAVCHQLIQLVVSSKV